VLDGSGQREATVGGGVLVSGTVTGWWAVELVAFRPGAAGSGAVAAVLSAVSRVCAGDSSARAFATEPRIAGSGFGAIGLAEGRALDGALCETLSPSWRRYQQWRLVPRSMR
jgi:hypothetical protein